MDLKVIDGLSSVVSKGGSKPIQSDTGFHEKFIESMSKYEDDSKAIDSGSFGEFLTDSIRDVSDAQHHADNMNQKLIVGETDNLHEVMIANQKAEMTLNFAIEVTNKVVEAYKEITRLQL